MVYGVCWKWIEGKNEIYWIYCEINGCFGERDNQFVLGEDNFSGVSGEKSDFNLI
jgi:hypothetical protein